jgi:D-sedoheptulose 7-phosphate isomerase
MNWSANVRQIEKCLRLLKTWGRDGAAIPVEDAFGRWVDLTVGLREKKKTVFLIGNGASASMASHVAADLAKNGHMHTEVFSDLSLITAIANDMGYDEVFAEPLRRRLKKGDMLVVISSSGRSANVLRAAEMAAQLGGIVVSLSAMKPDNPLSQSGSINFYIPAVTYGLAETCHAAILHHWIDGIIERNSV